MKCEEQLALVAKAWGKQKGYAFFPWISGAATSREERIRSFQEGRAYLWPKERDAILEHMRERRGDDLYWCPSLFEKKRRRMEVAMDEHALWADLDEVEPSQIEDYPPSLAWETSPGRYQALWLVAPGFDLQGASWQGGENQRLTYHLGADQGGWDTTQLLRFPGWPNHKPEHRGGTRDGPNRAEDLSDPPRGKLVVKSARRYLPDEFEDLPEVAKASDFEDILEDQIEATDAKEVWGRVRLKCSKAVRDLVGAREAQGDRSERLWQMERDLADAGCTAVEIVAVVRDTVWNKYEGRQDELRRLTIEAGRAIEARTPETKERVEHDRDAKPDPQDFFELVDNAKPPRWLVKGVWTYGSCGFIAGQPKSFKSWMALDLALSVATGSLFLGHFNVVQPGPVLYVQEEDGLPTLKTRKNKIWPSKLSDKMVSEVDTATGETHVHWVPAQERGGETPPMMALVRKGLVISDPGWQTWLDEQLAKGHVSKDGASAPYVMLVMDPLMMLAGEVEENRAQDMTERIFKPLKQLAEKHAVAVVLVHHMRKGLGSDGSNRGASEARGGQLMLGSVANHAWAEDALYVKHGKRGEMIVEAESKTATSSAFTVRNIRNQIWDPRVHLVRDDADDTLPKAKQEKVAAMKGNSPVARYLKQHGPTKASDLAEALGISRQGAYAQLNRLKTQNLVEKKGVTWSWLSP